MSQTRTASLDLNALRDTILQAQRNGKAESPDPLRQVQVDREGGISIGPATGAQRSSLVPIETFAGRLEDDRLVVRRALPSNTREMTTKEGITGFLYTIGNDLSEEYAMFAYFDGSYYCVKLVAPELEQHWKSPHTGHLYSNGKLCLGSACNGGRMDLESAFKKSCLWALGISIALKTGRFPFSINNLSD
jgi:hypothetical protein